MSISIDELQQKVTAAVEGLQALPHSRHWDRPLLRLQQRLETNQKLIAVFGAFSAGKSSMINALVGDNLLSVSPNPTTASVSQVQYGSHPGLQITAKTEEQLQRDVDVAMMQLHKEPDELSRVQQIAAEMKPGKFTPAQRKYVSFLKGFSRGYEEMRTNLGLTWDAPRGELHRYTADERIAGYVDSVTVSCDTDVLKDGLVLVDTPGVDSIHRRHTDVAFRYIQEADVVIFVLYYTHAFSRADKNFLQQLAGVQDVLGENKLIVAVNAVDLASSEEEKQDVLMRVKEELKKVGLAAPAVVPVSSQLALAAKQWEQGTATDDTDTVVKKRMGLQETDPLPRPEIVFEQSGFTELEKQVKAFANNHVQTMLLDSVRRIFSDTLGHISEHMHILEQRQSATETERLELDELRRSSVREIEDISTALENGQLSEVISATSDWKELGFHAAQRIRLKFPQLFREAFYPGRFRQESKAKLQLQDAASELATSIAMQLDIESRTLWLRFQSALLQSYEALRDKIGRILLNCQLERSELEHHEYTITDSDMPSAEADVSIDVFTPVLRHYKSARQFFEGGGQAAALEHAEELIQSLLHERIQTFQEQAEHTLRLEFGEKAERLCTDAAELIRGSLAGAPNIEAPLDVELDLEKWRELYQQFSTELVFLQSSSIS